MNEHAEDEHTLDPLDPLKLRIYPDPVLYRRGTDVPEMNDEVRGRIREMFHVMYRHGGIGLAAPQVGWSARVFVVNLTSDPEQPDDELVFVNPRLLSSGGSDTLEEGCLSLPDIRAEVARPARVAIAATDFDGVPFELTALDMLARCIQHEHDHLDGILFITRLTLTARLGIKRALKELERKFKEAKQAG